MYCTVLYCTVLCCAVLCCAVLCCAVLWCAVLCCAVMYCTYLGTKIEESGDNKTEIKHRISQTITKLDKEKNQCIRQKTEVQNIVKETKTLPEKVATTRTEDGHKETTKTSTTI